MTTETRELFVKGMTCAACARRVERAVKEIEGLRDVEVELSTGRVRFQLNGGTPTSEIVQAIERAGYTVQPGAAS